MNSASPKPTSDAVPIAQQVQLLLEKMTLAEKIGQMWQRNASEGHPADYLREDLRAGRVGAVINVVDVSVVNELQRIAVEESRLGIPLLVGRDVIHGFRTIMPLPLGLAATWNPALVSECARVSAHEAATAGINWTFAPMIDIARDPRWGRIAESFGEDVFLTSRLAEAMVHGFQDVDLSAPGAIAACAKHFAGYGAAESGRDYATTSIPEIELRNVYFPPFEAAVAAGVSTLMPSFCDLNGVPATGNEFLLRQVLRDEWGFAGVIVSDWDSVRQLSIHGLTEDDARSAQSAVLAGVDMEMEGDAYRNHLADLVEQGRVGMDLLDSAVARILDLKFRLGLFDNPYTDPADFPPLLDGTALETARRAALQSIVLLRNRDGTLPLCSERLRSVAVIGPLADAPHEQLGTWTFDGLAADTVTPLQSLRTLLGAGTELRHVPAMAHSRSRAGPEFEDAFAATRDADATIVFLGEEAILSGEAHSRADIGLPGDQVDLVRRLRRAGKPLVAVIMAGRPLTLTDIVDEVDALLFAWHPGTMGGPAIADLLFGRESPSGKLPATFPRMVGQVPIYYSQKNTGKPPTPDQVVHIDAIDPYAPQTSLGMTAFHLDAGYRPLFPFGFGLSYADFRYSDIRLDADEIRVGETLGVSVQLANHGAVAADEVVQLYVRDLVGSATRPVRELKGFRRVRVEPGESVQVKFDLHTEHLAFFGRAMRRMTEPGEFHAWIGGSSDADLGVSFRVLGAD
ncbi:glycoside hydrolase family 3 N-terminal domain-containing protein [Thioalkalivibrio sp. XN279]|uniref:glycoside hydrolase family 3 N-terminal domain-containing protein n=1 Tax=Thioalkalivibrio sp. XN279 TaxID=2714953 RepID=UPI00140D06FA|nr:glycoside hydrolase family 3 N-terminal domain-containing protein [Thioalkalivibrio sp. XN279]NHA13655.1 glycosyl hydrolase [Thioalkalivibrio sp. XN279]